MPYIIATIIGCFLYEGWNEYRWWEKALGLTYIGLAALLLIGKFIT